MTGQLPFRLPLALERGVSVIAGGGFNSGVLARPTLGATYDYANAVTLRSLDIPAALWRALTTDEKGL